MSDNGNKLKIDCTNCKLRFSVEFPVPEAVNVLRYSSIIAPHEKPARCPNCRQAFVVGVTHVKLDWGVQPIEEKVAIQLEGGSIIQVRGN